MPEPSPAAPDAAAPVPSGREREGFSHSCIGRVLQAAGPRRFEIVVIREGPAKAQMHGRPLVWTRDAIQSGVEAFAGARVGAYRIGQDFDHVGPDADKSLATLNLIGTLSNLRVEQAADGMAELLATLDLFDGVPPLVPALLSAAAGDPELVGFSIDAYADFEPGTHQGMEVTLGRRLYGRPDGNSLDMVSHPAAGGRVAKVAASITGGAAMADPNPTPATPKEPENKPAPEVNLADAVRQAVEPYKAATEKFEAELKALRVDNTRVRVEQACKDAELPDKAAALVRDAFQGAESVAPEALKAKIDAVKEAIAVPSKGTVTHPAGGIQMGLDSRDKLELSIEALLTPGHAPSWLKVGGKPIATRMSEAGVSRPFPSYREHFRAFVGHDPARVYTMDREDRKRIMQSISVATYGDAFENVLNRLVIAYAENPNFAEWRKIARIGNLKDLTTKVERITKGGYANLPSVGEGVNYTALTSPGDTGHGYTPAKYGGTEDLTWEAILRDDVGVLQDIPEKLGTAAARTLYEFCFDLLTIAGQPTMDYDSTTLFHANHSNLLAGSYAFSNSNLITALQAVRKQADQSNSKRLGLTANGGYLLHPVELQDNVHTVLKPLAAYAPGEATDNAYIRTFGLNPLTVRHWTNTTDYFVVCAPSEFPSLEVAFLNGNESPELYVQDNQTLGSMFDADKIVFKERYPFGGSILRHEGVYAVDSSA